MTSHTGQILVIEAKYLREEYKVRVANKVSRPFLYCFFVSIARLGFVALSLSLFLSSWLP
jgi:hypothetical protein